MSTDCSLALIARSFATVFFISPSFSFAGAAGAFATTLRASILLKSPAINALLAHFSRTFPLRSGKGKKRRADG